MVKRVQLGVFQTASLPVDLGSKLNSSWVNGLTTASVYLWENTADKTTPKITIRPDLFLHGVVLLQCWLVLVFCASVCEGSPTIMLCCR